MAGLELIIYSNFRINGRGRNKQKKRHELLSVQSSIRTMQRVQKTYWTSKLRMDGKGSEKKKAT